MKLYSVSRLDTPNIGDIYSSPKLYINYFRDSISFDIKKISSLINCKNYADYNDAGFIVGGGGLLDCDFFRYEIDLLNHIKSSALKVLWGVGLNNEVPQDINYLYAPKYPDLSNYDLIGVRDYPSRWDWVPCPSCLHEVFLSDDITPLYDVVVYSHYDNDLSNLSEYFPSEQFMSNSKDFHCVIKHLLSGSVVLTNSYHGAYWAQLLGRKVICFPTTNKFLYYKYPIPVCDPNNWKSYLKLTYVDKSITEESRTANIKFSEKVLEKIDNWNRGKNKKSYFSLVSEDVLSDHLNQTSYLNANGIDTDQNILKTLGEIAQEKVLSILTCPITKGPIDIIEIERCGYAILTGILWSPILNKIVGKIKSFQIDFIYYNGDINIEEIINQKKLGILPRIVNKNKESKYVSYFDDKIKYIGDYKKIEDESLMCIMGHGSSFEFHASGVIELQFSAHPWSGMIEISFGDIKPIIIDLYAPFMAIPKPYSLKIGNIRKLIKIKIIQEKNPNSLDRQCLFNGYKYFTEQLVPFRYERIEKHRGAPFSERFWSLLSSIPLSGILLDLGGGNRQVSDQRYINIDYAHFYEPDIIGNAIELPFRSDSVDVVYSSGVFEHISDPMKAAKEVIRVLKPGGRALICWSFMQPIHSEGQHYFNATPSGIMHAFANLKVINISYDTSLAFLMEWGISVSGIKANINTDDLDMVLHYLNQWDSLVTEEYKKFMANGIWIEFIKQ